MIFITIAKQRIIRRYLIYKVIGRSRQVNIVNSLHEWTEADLPLDDEYVVTIPDEYIVTIPAAKCVGYAVPISDTQELQVEVILYGADYEIRRWQAVPIGEWEPDDHLNIWTGEEE